MYLSPELRRQMDKIETKDHQLSMRGDVRYYRGDSLSFEDKRGREVKEGEWVLTNSGQRLGLVRYFQKRAEYKVIFTNAVLPLYACGSLEVIDVEL